MKKLRMKMDLPSTDRVNRLFHDHMKILHKFGYTPRDYYKESADQVYKQILEVLEPPILKDMIKEWGDLKAWKRLKKDYVFLMETIIIQVAIADEAERAAANVEWSGKQKHEDRQPPAHLGKKGAGAGVPMQPPPASKPGTPQRGTTLAKPAFGKDGPKPPGQQGKQLSCWHCSGEHYLSQCPTASPEQKAALVASKQSARI